MKKAMIVSVFIFLTLCLASGSILAEYQISEIVESEDMILIDSRSAYSYNGWSIDGKAGGHIPGAVLFSSKWLENLKTNQAVKDELTKFEIVKNKELYVYGDNSEVLVNKLNELGYKASQIKVDLKEYNDLAKMENFEMLVPPSWLNEKIKTDQVFVLEASWGDESEFLKGHIHGSVHINTSAIEEGPIWNRKSDKEIIKALGQHGINKEQTVVVYSVADTTPAARLASILKYAGVDDVRILDGNLKAWNTAGYELETEKVEVEPVDFGAEKAENPEYIIDLKEAKEVYNNPNADFIDVRSPEEFRGETTGYDYIPKAGRIKGAIYGYGGKNAYDMSDYRNPDNTMVSYTFMESRWSEQGIKAENHNNFYCGTGWRASEVWFYALALGWDNVSVYDGGWFEWSENKQPVIKE